LGKDDEIMELVKIILKEKKAEHKVINNTVEIDLEKDYVIYFWEHKFLGELSDMNYINVLE